MTQFSVLQRNQKIHASALIEASAGTGKTFAIENIVARLIIEEENVDQAPLTIDRILLVTFTKAATRDLKERIRQNLEKILDAFKSFLRDERNATHPDYILKLMEKGTEEVKKAKKRVESALFSYGQAQIFTIHGFCWRMLKNFSFESHSSFGTRWQEEEPLLIDRQLQAIRDFLRTEVSPDKYSASQLRILLNMHKGDLEKLQESLLKTVQKGLNVKEASPFLHLLEQFKKGMYAFQSSCSPEPNKILADFFQLAPHYKSLLDKNKQLSLKAERKIRRFASLFNKSVWNENDFDMLIEDGLFYLDAFHPSQLKIKAAIPYEKLHYPQLAAALESHLLAPISLARQPELLFSRLATDCQKFLKKIIREEEIFGHNDLLEQMRTAIQNAHFAEQVQTAYSAVIVDEFQDTDPAQWEIFSTLFTPLRNWNGLLYLVGDPKQSIYAFRQADIYTYLSAANLLGRNSMWTLDVNYRSHPALVQSLNRLFAAAPGMFPLPKLAQHLPYKPVLAGKKEMQSLGQTAPITFLAVDNTGGKRENFLEERYFFPAIAREILRLHEQEKIAFHQSAILVSDRYQAKRVAKYLKDKGIPVLLQKSRDLSRSEALIAFKELLNGILNYEDQSAFQIALSGQLIGFSHQHLLALEQQNKKAEIVAQFWQLHQCLIDDGFARCYEQFMRSVWHPDGMTVIEKLLARQDGHSFYSELQDIAELLISQQAKENLNPEGIIKFLETFEVLSRNEDERIKAFANREMEGVSILTTHVSKGLEFDIVFALGLMRRSANSEAELSQDSLYLQLCEETDAEKMRQLYVAFTRAKYRLYIPFVFNTPSKPDWGKASPLELFIARLNQPEADYATLYSRMGTSCKSAFEFIQASKEFSFHVLEEGISPSSYSPVPIELSLVAPPQIEIPGRDLLVHSFTSLTTQKGFEPVTEDAENIVPHDFNCDLKTIHTLPASQETGVFLHRIFEKVPFHLCKNARDAEELLCYIKPFSDNTRFEPWEHVLAEILLKAMKSPLNSFCLADLDPEKIYRETEFLYSLKEGVAVPLMQGYLKGVCDLFFEHEDKYYLLDWKSNWLGPSSEHYQANHLEEAMQQNKYTLQAELYTEAIRRYLHIFDQRSFEDIFGGVYYVFLRGVDGKGSGIWHSKRINLALMN